MNSWVKKSGFTIVELLITISIVAVVSAIAMISYSGIQARARDVTVQSDLDRLDALETAYSLKNNVSGKAYYSKNGADTDLGFTPSTDTVLVVTVGSSGYCIRGFNPNGTKNTLENSLTRESSSGVCALLAAVEPPAVPTLSVNAGGSGVQATIATLTCVSGTIQYSVRTNVNEGEWSSYSNWAANTTYTRTVSEANKYGYQAQAKCYVDENLSSAATISSVVSYQVPVNPPSTPGVAVSYSGGQVTATADTLTCTSGTPQYSFNYRLNESASWMGYGSWGSSNISTQSPSEGFKYGYKAKGRCYVSASLYSIDGSEGSESTYIHPIASAPSAPEVSSSSNSWPTTIFSWTAPTCPAQTTLSYQYRYTTSYGYDSGWVGTSSTSYNATTSSNPYTYTVTTQARCYTNFYVSDWSVSGSTTYTRGLPSMTAQAWGGGGGGCNGGGNPSGGDTSTGGGGGGGYSQTDVSLSSGSGYSVVVGSGGGVQSNGGDSFFVNTNTLLAKGGAAGNGSAAGSGGQAAAGTGGIRYSGGNGSFYDQGAGGGAAGPHGNGNSGSGETGGSGDNGSGGGGGVSGTSNPGNNGGSSDNGGGGGGGSGNNLVGGTGGSYGGGGGAGEDNGASGGVGRVVIFYLTGTMSASGGSVYTGGGYTYHVFTGSGTFTIY